MQANLLTAVIFLSTFTLSKTTLAPFITKCRSNDAECIRENAVVAIPLFAAGIPKLGVEILDPAFLDFVDGSRLNLKFMIYNVSVNGLKNCDAVDIHRDAPQSKLYIKLSCAADSNGQYELAGKVLALNIRGRGGIHVLLRRFAMAVVMDVEDIDGKDGKKHWNVTNFQYTFNLIEKSDVIFENLFQGNEALSTAASEAIKNSGNEIVREIGDPMFHAVTVKVIKNMNNFFNAVPIEDLSIN